MSAHPQTDPPDNLASEPRVLRLPPETYLVVSALFHYLGPALAVLLFAHIAPLGVAWLRIASAALVFAVWQRPWRLLKKLDPIERRVVLLFGIVLAAMNSVFYLAIAQLPLATVAAIEFLGVIALAAVGMRTRRNGLALVLAVVGVYLLTEIRIEGATLAYVLAFANCALFMLYVVLGHRLAEAGGVTGIERVSAAMLVAAIVALPLGIVEAGPALRDPGLLGAGIGVGVCSSVIPYVLDQLAMARVPRETFALMLTLLPATATVLGCLLLGQVPTLLELAGIGLVILGLAFHRSRAR